MIILHTNVLSALMHRTVDQRVVSWLDQQPRTSIWITAITLLEVQYGLQILATGKRRSALVGAFDGLLSAIDHLVLPFDEAAAQQAGDLMASRHKKDRPATCGTPWSQASHLRNTQRSPPATPGTLRTSRWLWLIHLPLKALRGQECPRHTMHCATHDLAASNMLGF